MSKILISNDGRHALYYFRLGLSRALTACGHEVYLWELGRKPPYDMFDELEPDIFLGQTYNLNDAMIQCIKERPHMKVALRASDLGNSIDRNKYPILYARDDEVKLVESIQDHISFLHIHYHKDWLQQTHGEWIQRGFNVVDIMNAADVFEYANGVYKEEFASDIAFVGGRWGYKSQTLDKWLVPLCQPSHDLNIKIFGNQPWSVPQYMGCINDEAVKDILASAKICPNISEPHSQDYGYDVIERVYKLLSNRCFVISDYVEAIYKLFPNGIVLAKTPKEFQELIYHYLKHPEEKVKWVQSGYDECIAHHTYFSRAGQLLSCLGYKNESASVESIKNNIFTKLQV